MAEYIDMTPKWGEVINDYFRLLEHGNEEGKEFARVELTRMAEGCDFRNDEVPADRKIRPSARLMLHMARNVRR